jgi:hypothetical protein
MPWLIPLIGTSIAMYWYDDVTESDTEAAGLTGDQALEFQRLEAEIAAANAKEAQRAALMPYAIGAAAVAGVAGIAYAVREKK